VAEHFVKDKKYLKSVIRINIVHSIYRIFHKNHPLCILAVSGHTHQAVRCLFIQVTLYIKTIKLDRGIDIVFE